GGCASQSHGRCRIRGKQDDCPSRIVQPQQGRAARSARRNNSERSCPGGCNSVGAGLQKTHLPAAHHRLEAASRSTLRLNSPLVYSAAKGLLSWGFSVVGSGCESRAASACWAFAVAGAPPACATYTRFGSPGSIWRSSRASLTRRWNSRIGPNCCCGHVLNTTGKI